MTQPATGTTPSAGGYLDVDNRFQGGHRTGLIAVFFRDFRGAATNISPHSDDNGTVAWSPFALDGKLRDDLRAFKRVGGSWVRNTDTNEGWIQAGAFGDGNGPSQKPNITTDKQRIEQSAWPFEQEVTEQEEPFTFQALQNLWPGILRLRNNLPLSDANGNLLVETPGQANFGVSQQLEPGGPARQFLLYGIRKREGKYVYEVDAYDYCTLSNIGERKFGKKGTAAELTFDPAPSGYFMGSVDGKLIPIIKHTFIGGDAWSALGTSPVSKYTVSLGTPSAGNFKLGLVGGSLSADIAYSPAPTAVKSAVVAIDDGYTASDWTVTGTTGGPFEVTVPAGRQLTGDGTGLTGGTFSITPVAS